MKHILALVIFITSTSTFARQYIQCSHSDPQYTDVMVLNLTTKKSGTLFLSSGMQNPDDERILVNVEFQESTNQNYVYRVISSGVIGIVTVPEMVIGKSSNSFFIHLLFNGYEVNFGCFSRIYEDN
jgi:hypothetical protein